MAKDVLFLLAAPFEDAALEQGALWFCSHCAMLEGALLANPHWAEAIEIRRIAFAKPRQEVIALLGEENQRLPVLAREQGEPLHDPTAIAEDLARRFGGARPHP
jgi:hypothetical protein